MPVNALGRRPNRLALGVAAVAAALVCGCDERPGPVEVTAQLVDVPAGAIFKRDLYDYATVLKYRVLKVHRGRVAEDVIYVAHYNPFKRRSEAADRRVKNVGGNLEAFVAGEVHRMVLEPDAEAHYMGGVVNLYFDQGASKVYWAVRTDRADR